MGVTRGGVASYRTAAAGPRPVERFMRGNAFVAGAVSAWVLAGGHSAACASPLDLGCVEAGAPWIAHWDVDAGRSSVLGRAIAGEGEGLPARTLRGIERDLGVPGADVRGVTLYGLERCSTRQAMIVTTTSAGLEAFRARMSTREAGDVREGDVATLRYYSWTRNGARVYATVASRAGRAGASDEAAHHIVLTDTPGTAVRAAAVVAGAQPSRAETRAGGDGSAGPGGSPGPGAILFVWAGGLSECPPGEAQVFRASRSLAVEVGEDPAGEGARFFARARMEMATGAQARRMEDVVRGAVSLAALSAAGGADEAGLTRAAERLETRVEDSTLWVSCREESGTVSTLLGLVARRALSMPADDEQVVGVKDRAGP